MFWPLPNSHIRPAFFSYSTREARHLQIRNPSSIVPSSCFAKDYHAALDYGGGSLYSHFFCVPPSLVILFKQSFPVTLTFYVSPLNFEQNCERLSYFNACYFFGFLLRCVDGPSPGPSRSQKREVNAVLPSFPPLQRFSSLSLDCLCR